MENLQTNKKLFKVDEKIKEPIGKLLLDYLKQYSDNNNKNINDLTLEELEKEIVLFPSVLNSKLAEYIKNFDNLSPEEVDELPDDVRMLLLKLGDVISAIDNPSSTYLFEKDITKKPLHNESVVNDIKYNDKDYGISYPTIKKVKSDASFLMELQEGVGLGKMTKIILWNSGLWLTIRPPQNEDLINLYTKLTQEIDYISENTTMYGFSNISTVFYKVVWEYVVNHLVDSSLNVNPKYLARYISILDMDTILLGVLSQLFYNGFNTTLLCKNNYELDENGKPKCNYSYKINLDLPKLLWTDTSRLNTEMMSIISKRGPRSQKIEDIKEYQKHLQPNDVKTIITLNNGKELELELGIPNLETSFDNSEIFILEINKFINKSLSSIKTDEDTETIKDNLKGMAVKTLFLGIYSQYVKSMTLGTFKTDKQATILEALKTLSTNATDVNNIINKINNFITNASITTIAIPDFVCPVCGASQATNETAFEDLVPVNMVNYFFTLSKLRFMKQLLEKAETK